MKHMIGIAFRQWRNWSPLYDMCWSRFSLLKNGNSMIWSIGVAFHQWKNWSPLYDMCWSRLSFLNRRNPMIWSTWSALPFNERTDHHFTICADQDFRFSKTETRWFEAHDRRCLSPSKELITTLRYVLNKIFFLKDGNLMIWSTWSALPFTNERTDHHFTTCADQDFPFSKTETQWFEAHDRHCLSPMKELITTLRFVLIKIGNLMIWSTWSALPFTSERTDHHFTICADQDFPLPKTETRWFERHDRHCLLDDSKDMIGIVLHQR